MRKKFSKIVHILFLPCSKATLLLEKRHAETISPKENRQLSLHIILCKWCKAYKKKLQILDNILEKKVFQGENADINDAEIEKFKNKMIQKLNIK